jgi:type I restriction enzyme S subunit
MTEGPYKLPEGWRWVRLGEVCDYKSGVWGQTDPNGTPVLRSTDFLPDGNLSYETAVRLALSEKQLKKAVLQPGDILLERSGGGPNKPVGRVAYFQEQGTYCCGNFITRLRVSRADVMSRFLFYFLFHFHISGRTESLQTQTTNIRNLRFNEYLAIAVPLPPLEEQRRIVARIEELMGRVREARRLREEAKNEAERLWQAILAQTFPRPGSELPEGWRWVKVGEMFELQQGAAMSPERRLGRSPKPFLRTKNILWGAIDISSLDEMDFTDEEVQKLRLQPGDLLVCEGGEVGKTAVWEGQLPLVLYQNHIHRLRAKDKAVDPKFVMFWMQAAYQVFQIYQGAESKTAIPNLSGKRLKEFVFPLPPLEEQRRIVAHLQEVQEKIKALKEAQEQTEAELKRLEQAILEKAFRGEL